MSQRLSITLPANEADAFRDYQIKTSMALSEIVRKAVAFSIVLTEEEKRGLRLAFRKGTETTRIVTL